MSGATDQRDVPHVVEEESGDCFQHVGTERVSLRFRSLWEKGRRFPAVRVSLRL